MADAPRDNKGRVGPGNNLRGTATRLRAKRVSRALKREMIRRFENAPLDPKDPAGEKFGKDRAVLRHYFSLIDIFSNKSGAEKSTDIIKAVIEFGNRLDGKPVETIDLQGEVETGSPLDKAVSEMTPEQLLELVRAARGH